MIALIHQKVINFIPNAVKYLMIGSNQFKIAMRLRVSSVVPERGRDGRGKKVLLD